MKRALLPLLAALLLAPASAQAPINAELESHLAQLVQEGLDHPDKVLTRLAELRKGDAPAAAIDFAEARVLLDVGRLEAAQLTAKRLADQPAQAGRLATLRALIDDRRGDAESALTHAAKAVELLAPGCPVGDERAAIERGSCDFRPLWAALRLQETARRGNGQLQQGVELAKRELSLAQAGGDQTALLFSHGSLALLYQALEQQGGRRTDDRRR